MNSIIKQTKYGVRQAVCAITIACALAITCAAAVLCAGEVSAADGVDIPLTVINTVTGDTPAAKENFTFVLGAESVGAPLPDSTEVSISGSGEASFGNIAFTDEGQYKYKLYEREGNTSGYSYDDTVYHILVDASWQSGKLVTQVVAWKGNVQSEETKVASLAFENKYSSPSTKMHTIMAIARQGGSISPSGSISVASGKSLSLSIMADSGYKISDVLVDGVSVGAVNAYEFEDVQADHRIVAMFAEDDGKETPTATPTETPTQTPSAEPTMKPTQTPTQSGSPTETPSGTNGSSGDTGNSGSAGGAKTGDGAGTVAWFLVISAACAGLAAALFRLGKKEKE